MIMLNNGYYCSLPKIWPSNWDTSNASLKTTWGVHYRIYPPGGSKPTQVKIKKGINRFHTLTERRSAASLLLTETLSDLQNNIMPYPGYKPTVITSTDIPGTKSKSVLKKAVKTPNTLRDLWLPASPTFDEIIKNLQEKSVAYDIVLIRKENNHLCWNGDKKFARGFIHICLSNGFINSLPGKNKLSGKDIIQVVNNTFPNIKVPIKSEQDWNQQGLAKVHKPIIEELKAMMRLP